MLTTGMDNHARPGMACSECNDLLVAPKSSAYVSNHEIRHVWSCESCGHEIEMAVNLRFDNHVGTELYPIANL
jgi:RNase P subunit RPR2